MVVVPSGNIAGHVQKGGKQVTTADGERARQEGATGKEIYDAVLFANRFRFCSKRAGLTLLGAAARFF
jgi:hypothetical protein